ncbi:MAG: PEGA domain-containing protein [Sandaracinaceae bacterium]|nr:PEGA domain-containing protein [Sandaracinaceae bacterium]
MLGPFLHALGRLPATIGGVSAVRIVASLAVLALLALGPTKASAQREGDAPIEVPETTPTEAPTSPDDTQRVAVVLLPRGAASPEMTDSLTELLIAALAARGATEIVGKEEFQAALGRDDAGTLACIESDACLGRMGRELRVHELVAGTLHLEPPVDGVTTSERFRFELYRLDVQSGSARGRVAREIEGGLEALIAALTTSVDELYVERIDPGAIVIETQPQSASVEIDDEAIAPSEDGMFRRGFLVPGEHELLVRASGYRGLTRAITVESGTTLMLSVELEPRVEELSITTTTWALAGSGAAILIGGGALGGASQATATDLNMRQSQSFYDARQVEATLANVLFAVGGALLVGAAVSFGLDVDASSRDVAERAMHGEIARW